MGKHAYIILERSLSDLFNTGQFPTYLCRTWDDEMVGLYIMVHSIMPVVIILCLKADTNIDDTNR